MKNYTLIAGLICGMSGIVITTVTYFLGVTAMISWWTVLVAFVLGLSLYFYFGYRYRKMNGGFLPFKDAFLLIFLMSAIASTLSGLFMILLYHVISPDLPEKMYDAVIVKTTNMLQGWGMTQDKVDATINKMQSDPNPFSLGRQFRSIGINFIGCAIFALIIGAIIKKNRPPFENVIDQPPQ